MLLALLLAACVPGDQPDAGKRAAMIASSLAVKAGTVEEGGGSGACGDSLSMSGVEAIASTRLDSLKFDSEVRCVRRVNQRPATLRIDEIGEIVAWRDRNGQDSLRMDAMFVAVSYGPSTDSADARSLWPLAAVLAALERFVERPDSIKHDIVLTLGAVPEWDVLDASPLEGTASAAFDSPYRSDVQVSASSGPSPPLVRPRQPGILIGLIPKSDLPVSSHDPRSRMLAEGSVFGHSGWNIPGTVSASTSGDMLALTIADDVAAGDSAVLSDLTGVAVRALQEVDGWTGPGQLPSALALDLQTVFWLLGIVLQIAFVGLGTWLLLVRSLTDIGNVKRALRRTDADMANYLRSQRRRRIVLERVVLQLHSRLARVEAVVKWLSRRLEADTANRSPSPEVPSRLGRLRRALQASRGWARRTARAISEGVRDLAVDRKHKLDRRIDREAERLGMARKRAGCAKVALYEMRGEKLVAPLWRTHLWYRLEGSGDACGDRATKAKDVLDRCPDFVASRWQRWVRLREALKRCKKAYELRRVTGQAIVGGVWEQVWNAITDVRGAFAFAIGAIAVVAAVLAQELIAVGGPMFPWGAIALLVFYLPSTRWEDGRPMVWGAAAVTMLGLTTIELTSLRHALETVFDSQRLAAMQLIVVAILFIGQEFGRRAGNRETPEKPDKDIDALLRAAGAKRRNARGRERFLLFLAVPLYVFACAHFLAPAVECRAGGCGLRVGGAALSFVLVTAAVILLPVFSLCRAWKAGASHGGKKNGGADG